MRDTENFNHVRVEIIFCAAKLNITLFLKVSRGLLKIIFEQMMWLN